MNTTTLSFVLTFVAVVAGLAGCGPVQPDDSCDIMCCTPPVDEDYGGGCDPDCYKECSDREGR